MKTLPPAMTGLECPCPGSGAFQRMFLSLLHSIGSPVCPETPEPLGPRNCGQSPPLAEDARSRPSTRAINPRSNGVVVIAEVLAVFARQRLEWEQHRQGNRKPATGNPNSVPNQPSVRPGTL